MRLHYLKLLIMRKLIVASFAATLFISCGNSSSEKKFTVTGTITNSTAKMIYLEKVPASYYAANDIGFSKIRKDGKFSLKADARESVVYNLRLDQNEYPVASVINDVDKCKIKYSD